MEFLILLLAILPGLLITWYMYRRDTYQRERPHRLAISFGLGMAATLPIIQLEQWAHRHGWYETDSAGLLLFSSFVLVAFNEELVKFLILTLYPYRQPFFNEPLDGIVYAVAIAMGFATLENVLYAYQYGLETILMRAFTAVPGHAAFAVIMGYFIGRSKFAQKKRKRLLAAGLLLPVVIHGTYNFLILQEAWDGLVLFAVPLLAVSIYFAWKLIGIQQERSPFRHRAEKEQEDRK